MQVMGRDREMMRGAAGQVTGRPFRSVETALAGEDDRLLS